MIVARLNRKKERKMARLNHDAYPVLDHTSLVSPVVFVVDMVNGFVKEGALADPAIAKCIAPIETLLKSCTPVQTIFVNDTHEPDAAEFASFPPALPQGQSGSAGCR